MRAQLKFFWFSITATILTVIAAAHYLGISSLIPLTILIIIEITFSFDNAIVNAKILKKMSPAWQRVFLSVGIIIAIFGMRLIFPIAIVALTADLSWRHVIDLALHHPTEYAARLDSAHPVITAFGGAFLLMLALHFFMEEGKEHHWFYRFERFLQRRGASWMPTVITAVSLILLSLLPLNHHRGQTLRAGFIGLAAFLAIYGLNVFIAKTTIGTNKRAHYIGWAAFSMFMYLELLDASFSLDGVLGAFAITSNVILIMAGLGVGAVWVRALTVYMVRKGTLDAYRFLEHGAHYAIAVLAVALLLSVIYSVPEVVTGVIGLGFIIGSVIASKREPRST
jgi:hypothetical protein